MWGCFGFRCRLGGRAYVRMCSLPLLLLLNHRPNHTNTKPQMLGNVGAARQIFERWMEWEPDDNGWNAYIKFEMRQQEPQRARQVRRRTMMWGGCVCLVMCACGCVT